MSTIGAIPLQDLPIGLELVTAPATTPVTLVEAKAHMKVEGNDEDDLITDKLFEAVAFSEDSTGRQLLTATWRQTLQAFPGSRGEIELERPPLISVTEIHYIDQAGDVQVMDPSDYEVDTSTILGTVGPAHGRSWPSVRRGRKAVQITLTAGYGAADKVPRPFKSAIKIITAHLYNMREPVVSGTTVTKVPMSADSLLSLYRVVRIP